MPGHLAQVPLSIVLFVMLGCACALDVSDLVAAFESNDGLTLRVTEPREPSP